MGWSDHESIPGEFQQGEVMLVVLACCASDVQQMRDLLLWISKLGERKRHCALIVADAGTGFDDVIGLRELCEGMFREVRLTTNGHTVSGWPSGANSLFKAAATYVREQWPEPFLWIESDCVPLRAGWLDTIENQYHNGELGAYMGHIYDCTQPFLPTRLMSAIAVYPHCAAWRLPMLAESPRAWEVDGAEIMVADGRHTPLIHHFWGQPNLPPTFVARKDAHSPVNAMTLEDIPKEACLFHRCKNGSLQRLLERKLFPQEFRHPIAVCFNVHAGDLNLAIQHSQWLRTLALKTVSRRWDHKAVICHDPSCPVVGLNLLEQNLRHCFTEVETCVYSRPPIPTYPASANFAFQSVALYMAKQKSPWLWFEADAVALKSDWIEQLQTEYDGCGRSWMGPVVQHMNHLQGTSIYPADAALRMPGAMSCGAGHAFDMQTKDVIHDCHDASHLMHHCWSLLNRMSHPVGGGEIPANITADELRRWLPRGVVFLHRVKDNSVLNALLTGQYVHQL